MGFFVYLLILRLAPHQLTASAYLVRDYAVLRLVVGKW